VVFVRFEEMPGFGLEAGEVRLADLGQCVLDAVADFVGEI